MNTEGQGQNNLESAGENKKPEPMIEGETSEEMKVSDVDDKESEAEKNELNSNSKDVEALETDQNVVEEDTSEFSNKTLEDKPEESPADSKTEILSEKVEIDETEESASDEVNKQEEKPVASGADNEDTGELKVVQAPGEEEKPAKEDSKQGEVAHAEEHHLDYTDYSKKQMVQVLESLLKEDDFSQIGRILKEIKKPFDKLVIDERQLAFKKYIDDGGEKDGFEFRQDEVTQRFNAAYNKLRERKNEYFNSLEIKKEQNLQKKQEILEKLRELVDSEETGASIKSLKELQELWKEVGPVPSAQLKSLWANYNALLDRFYDNRSIYFELKELDRKKNYDLKIELCKKAEQLDSEEDIKEVIKQLNELHEEFKHIGPVPKEDQETLWERFKTASDKIYAKRKDYYEHLKQEFKTNQVAKEALVERVIPFVEFNSSKISDWNSKTKEIIAIQKEWEAIGSLPKEKAKKINKQFWSSFKTFFNHKGQFFKKIEEERKGNLELKQKLVEKAEELKDSEDFRKTTDEMKRLQMEWKNIGKNKKKYRNEIFANFKKACDHFFDRRRANTENVEKDYVENLKKKEALCEELESMIKEKSYDLSRVKGIEEEWGNIGYVPKSSIKSIQKRLADAIDAITDDSEISESEKHEMRFKAQFGNMNLGPGSERMLQKKEGALRRQISSLENDISLWRNNMDFFASSKNADKLKQDFQVKIDKASAQLNDLKQQLKIISNI